MFFISMESLYVKVQILFSNSFFKFFFDDNNFPHSQQGNKNKMEYLVKFSFSEKATKIWAILLMVLTFTLIFVAFSEKLNFKN